MNVLINRFRQAQLKPVLARQLFRLVFNIVMSENEKENIFIPWYSTVYGD